MRVDIITLFPDIFEGPLTESIIGRAGRKGVVDIHLVNLRDFATDSRGTVDDAPFGGGAGMVLKPEPLFDAVESVKSPAARVIFMTPQGMPFKQRAAETLAMEAHLIILCGHYEGIDERVRQTLVDDEISIGDFILTNGAVAAMVVLDSVVRLLPGALGSEESAEADSFSNSTGQLDFPAYTRPANFRGLCVPDTLLSGDHARIATWRHQQSQVRTTARRPDLMMTSNNEN